MRSNFINKTPIEIKHRSKTVKRTACVLTAGMMLFSGITLTGCGKKDAPSASVSLSESDLKAISYDLCEFTLAGENNYDETSGSYVYYGDVQYMNGKLYAIKNSSEYTEENYSSKTSIVVTDSTGTVLSEIPVAESSNDSTVYSYIQGGITVDTQGNISLVLTNSEYTESGEYSETQELRVIGPNGSVVSSLPLDNILSEEERNDMWIQSCVLGSDGNIYCSLGTCVRVLDKEGKQLFTTKLLDETGNTWFNSFFFTNNGVPAVSYSTYDEATESSGYFIREIDTANKDFGKEYTIASSLMGQMYNGGGDYYAVCSSDSGLKGLRLDEATGTFTSEYIINLLGIGVDTSNLNTCTLASDGTVVITCYGNNGETLVALASAAETSTAAEKKVITLGCFSLDYNIRSGIAEFNKTSSDYILQVESFSENNDTSDWEAALTKFNNEILAGNVPDILLLNDQMPVESYANKGMFVDLYEFIEKDDTLTKDTLAPNVIKALEKNGKLYSLTPSYYVTTFAGKKSLFGTDNLTYAKVNEVLAAAPEGASLFSSTTQASSVVQMGIQFGNFIDYSSNTCNFDCSEFKALLETAKQCPIEVDWDKLYNENPNFWEESEASYSAGKTLISDVYLSSFDGARYTEAMFGEDISYIGFPTETGEKLGAGLYAQSEMAICSKAADKEGAWQFIKQIMTKDTTQNGRYYYNFPVYLPEFEKMAAATLENAKNNAGNETYWVNNQEVKLQPIDEAYINIIKDFVLSVDSKLRYDNSLLTIIEEETAAYFNGTKSVDETASIIQSRASIYLSEQS
ncbi:MAG: ABC transporter substrate-binding protein [Huintestinicola sp.]